MSSDMEQKMQDQIESGLIAQEEFEERVERMTNRFLAMKLPDDFSPDGAISLDKEYSDKFGMGYGTNIFNHKQARQMILHILKDAD